jgi:hypothetical protein
VPEFTTTLKIVARLAIVSATFAVGVATLNAYIPLTLAPDLIPAFLKGFTACLLATLWLLARRMPPSRRKKR